MTSNPQPWVGLTVGQGEESLAIVGHLTLTGGCSQGAAFRSQEKFSQLTSAGGACSLSCHPLNPRWCLASSPWPVEPFHAVLLSLKLLFCQHMPGSSCPKSITCLIFLVLACAAHASVSAKGFVSLVRGRNTCWLINLKYPIWII